MRIPIRMIGIATTFFWLFLIVFFVSAVYSVKDVRFDFKDPQMGLTADDRILFFLPITIDNWGYYNIGSFNVTTEILDKRGCAITHGCTFIPVIERGGRTIATHNMTIDMNHMLQNSEDYLFNDMKLRVHETVGMKLAEVIPVQISANLSIHWGAPLYNFVLGEVEYTAFNRTHFTVTVPISFENHAFFNLTGITKMSMYNSTDAPLGRGETRIEALHNAPYKGYIELEVPMAGLTENGYFKVYYSTSFFDFGPLVFPYD